VAVAAASVVEEEEAERVSQLRRQLRRTPEVEDEDVDEEVQEEKEEEERGFKSASTRLRSRTTPARDMGPFLRDEAGEATSVSENAPVLWSFSSAEISAPLSPSSSNARRL